MRKSFPRIWASVFFLCLLGALSPRFASPEFFFDDYDVAHMMDIVVGESKVVPVSNPKRVAVGNPDIADVVGAGTTELLVSAKAAGETNLQIWDDFGQREIAVRVFAEDLGKLKSRLEDLFETAGLNGVTFQVGDKERKVFILGRLPDRKQEITKDLLESFKDKVINLITFEDDSPLVEIDVQVLEIQKTALDKLGVNWTSSFTFNETTPSTHTLNRHLGDIIKAIGQSQFDRTALTAVLNVLEQDNLARTLARPKLVALSGKEAKFLVGGEAPILSSVSVASGTTTTSVEYQEYGIKLSIRPEVKESGNIFCQLEIQIRSIDTASQLTVQTGSSISSSTPGFKTREVTTELYLKNNTSLFLAGLIDNNEANNLQRVPGLGSVPILGALFRSKDFQVGATELVVSLTPKIVSYGAMETGAPSAGAGRMGQASDENPADSYTRLVQETILNHVAYPMEARRANLSGSVVLSLHLTANGQLVNAVVSESSGHPLLDKAALYTVKRLAPYPAFPGNLTLKEIWIEVPINYQLS
ncbi:MAG: TonB family protein [Deltaproteobacteria bacterium]